MDAQEAEPGGGSLAERGLLHLAAMDPRSSGAGEMTPFTPYTTARAASIALMYPTA